MFDSKETIIITDFDGTLSKRHVNGQSITSIMTIIKNEGYLSPQASKEAKKINSFYYPIEQDPDVDFQYKSRMMEEWWQKSYELMSKGGLSRKILDQVISHPSLQLRDRTIDFFQLTAKNDVPVIVYSASSLGIDVIQRVLKERRCWNDNVKVVSNHLEFDEQGNLVKTMHPHITSVGKTGSKLHELGAYQNGTKKQCLIIGDALTDARMADGLDFDLIYKVAFVEHDIEHFVRAFDETLHIDADFSRIIELLR